MGIYDKVNQGDIILSPAGGNPDPQSKKPAQRDVLDFEKMMASEPATELQTCETGVECSDTSSMNVDVIDYRSEYEAEMADSGEELFKRSIESLEKLQDEWVQTIGKLEHSELPEVGEDNIDTYVDNMREMAQDTRESLFVATKYQTITSFGSIILQQLGNLMSFIKS
jgi:hypothetical protein